jgi:FlaA1/EpsC-like NDP-sugar epimerase
VRFLASRAPSDAALLRFHLVAVISMQALPRHPVWDVQPESLLGRKPFPLDPERVRPRIQGRVVMVTGAAGSIGSELCRQVAALEPQALVGLDQAETPLFLLERELSGSFPRLAFYPQLGSAGSFADAHRTLARFHPKVVYHAAAYKHVSMMERNVLAAVENNILATWQMARAAAENGVEHFVLISTDKAVHPTSVMGATKRVAELAVRSLQKEQGTRFVAVRFGNVLGSSGSVLPIFQAQIAAGGPVTVTDARMKRYFMTAPEAAQLVLRASIAGAGGEVLVLDMGEPMGILDLARRLIELSRLSPHRDIGIEFTGARQGEKLVEELHLPSESLVPTEDDRIRRLVSAGEPDAERTHALLLALEDAVEARDDAGMLALLKEAAPDDLPAAQLISDSAMTSK